MKKGGFSLCGPSGKSAEVKRELRVCDRSFRYSVLALSNFYCKELNSISSPKRVLVNSLLVWKRSSRGVDFLGTTSFA